MDFKGKLIQRQGDKGFIEIEDVNWFEVNKKASGVITVVLEEKDKISDQQRKLLYALWRDYENYTGTPLDAAEAWFKYQFMLKEDLDEFPSLARGVMSKAVATEFVTFVLEYYLDNGIPFAQRDWYKGADVNRICYAMLMNRICFVCGKPHSDIHHISGFKIGMGNNRNKVNHKGRYVACLCREDHGKVHDGSEIEFFNKNHIVPIKLNEHDAMALGLGG